MNSGLIAASGQIITYDQRDSHWNYPASMLFEEKMGNLSPWNYWLREDAISAEDAQALESEVTGLLATDETQTSIMSFSVKDARGVERAYAVTLLRTDSRLHIMMHDINDSIKEVKRLERLTRYDRLTGLMKREYFLDQAGELVFKNARDVEAGKYVMGYLDVFHFKAINDIFGSREGDRLLNYIADALREMVGETGLACRINADKFLFFMNRDYESAKTAIKALISKVDHYNLGIDVISNVGYYVTNDATLPPENMADRAIMAEKEIKGKYSKRHNSYRDDLRKDILNEQVLVGDMRTALAEGRYVVYYQPQFNHRTGALVGTEALIRWEHPEYGMISPGNFVPLFERTGFVTEADLSVFETVCKLLRKCLNEGTPVVPISSNISRHDMYDPEFIDRLEEIRKKYNIPVKYLRLEITESAVMGDEKFINEFVGKLHDKGYIVEMDDFGSGYSSLNVLKDIDMDIIKLDMKFFSTEHTGSKSIIIVKYVVGMANRLGMPVIAEGVETKEQADFLKQTGNVYIQGYVYSRPVPEEKFLGRLKEGRIEEMTNFDKPYSEDTAKKSGE